MSFSSNEGPWKLKKKSDSLCAASGSGISLAFYLSRVYVSDFDFFFYWDTIFETSLFRIAFVLNKKHISLLLIFFSERKAYKILPPMLCLWKRNENLAKLKSSVTKLTMNSTIKTLWNTWNQPYERTDGRTNDLKTVPLLRCFPMFCSMCSFCCFQC